MSTLRSRPECRRRPSRSASDAPAPGRGDLQVVPRRAGPFRSGLRGPPGRDPRPGGRERRWQEHPGEGAVGAAPARRGHAEGQRRARPLAAPPRCGALRHRHHLSGADTGPGTGRGEQPAARPGARVPGLAAPPRLDRRLGAVPAGARSARAHPGGTDRPAGSGRLARRLGGAAHPHRPRALPRHAGVHPGRADLGPHATGARRAVRPADLAQGARCRDRLRLAQAGRGPGHLGPHHGDARRAGDPDHGDPGRATGPRHRAHAGPEARGDVLAGVDLDVRAGEVVGVTGLVGAGKSELGRAVYGADPIDEGTIRVDGQVRAIRSPAGAVSHGIALVPEDRKSQGLFLTLSVADNLTVGVVNCRRVTGTVARMGQVISGAKASELARRYISRFRIRTRDEHQPVVGLSGGNQQKVVLSKCLATKPVVMILDEPTRGVDVGSKAEIYRVIAELAAAGVGVLMLSSEVQEVVETCDRIYVLRQGRVAAEVAGNEATEGAVMRYATAEAAG